MKKAAIAFVLALLVASLTGCVTTNATTLGTATAQRPALAPEQVALYRLASQVPGKYEEIALLNSAGDSGFTDEARMFQSMKKKAGELGANAVILDAVSEPSAGAKVAAAIFGVSAQRKGKAVAIYISPGSAPSFPTAEASAQPQNGECVSCAKIARDFNEG